MANAKWQSGRLTAVMAVTAAGKKHPILFIFKSKQSRCIEKKLKLYPGLHYYICTKKAWIEQSIWNCYIDLVLAPKIENPLLLTVDNLDSHMLVESVNYCAEQLGSDVYSLLKKQLATVNC
jgi:hypothetical protein